MSDKVNRFPPVGLAQFALLLCALQWLLTLALFLTSRPPTPDGGSALAFSVRGLLFLLACVALPLVSFWGLVRRKAYGRWLSLVTLTLEWVFILHAEVTRPEWPHEVNRVVFVIIFHGLLHALFLGAIVQLAFSKRVSELLRGGMFRPRMPDVVQRPGLDALFAKARAQANPEPRTGDEVEGRRAIALVTPGREVMPLPCPAPGSVADEHVSALKALLPHEPPLNVTAIAYTSVEALAHDRDKTKCIPFLGDLVGLGYIGHSVVVFEGHPSAFESGVRDSDVLMVDSGMTPFLQGDWMSAARRVMRPGGKILIFDRKTNAVSLVGGDGGQSRPPDGPKGESFYAERLLAVLAAGRRYSAVITSGRTLPPISDFTENPADLELSAGLVPERLNADAVIDIIANAAGLRGRSGVLKVPLYSQPDGRHIGVWTYHVELQRDAEGRRQLLIER